MAKKFDVMDLTSGQVEDIEVALGVPVSRWAEDVPSQSRMYRLILAAKNGVDESTLRDITLTDLMAQVSLGAEPDPKD